MTAHRPLYPNRPLEPDTKPEEPTVFVRTFSTPPGLPWDQQQAAALDARSGAPLPLAEVTYQLRRLEPWSMGRPARFAALYVRVQEVGQGLDRTVQVNGRPLRVRFFTALERNRRARRLGLVAVAAGSFALVTSGAVTTALAVRQEAVARLDALDQIAAAKHKVMREAERERLIGLSLDAEGVKSFKLGEALADLTWASTAKAPDARIEALHWDHGHMAFEVRGDVVPFASSDRTIIKASKPIRPRVWLWGVEPRARRP